MADTIYQQTRENDGSAWPQRDGLKWPHLARSTLEQFDFSAQLNLGHRLVEDLATLRVRGEANVRRGRQPPRKDVFSPSGRCGHRVLALRDVSQVEGGARDPAGWRNRVQVPQSVAAPETLVEATTPLAPSMRRFVAAVAPHLRRGVFSASSLLLVLSSC